MSTMWQKLKYAHILLWVFNARRRLALSCDSFKVADYSIVWWRLVVDCMWAETWRSYQHSNEMNRDAPWRVTCGLRLFGGVTIIAKRCTSIGRLLGSRVSRVVATRVWANAIKHPYHLFIYPVGGQQLRTLRSVAFSYAFREEPNRGTSSSIRGRPAASAAGTVHIPARRHLTRPWWVTDCPVTSEHMPATSDGFLTLDG